MLKAVLDATSIWLLLLAIVVLTTSSWPFAESACALWGGNYSDARDWLVLAWFRAATGAALSLAGQYTHALGRA